MAHFANIDKNRIVTSVIVADQSFIDSGVVGNPTTWIQTSYNTRGGVHYGADGKPDGQPALRKNYAGIGYTYDIEKDAFVPPSPYPSWRLNVDTCLWNPPTEYPADGKLYAWNEESTSWVEVQTDPNSPINK